MIELESDLPLLLDALVTGLALVLAALAFAAARRYSELRFALVGIALLSLAIVGILGFLSFWTAAAPAGWNLGLAPAALILVAEALLYASLVVTRPAGWRRANG
jgi:hypothetical protein